MSMRWLVPTAAASSRRLRSPMPAVSACCMAAASRRSRACDDGTSNCTIWYRTERADKGGSMAQLHVEAEGTSRATPDAVWRLVGDADRFAEWGPWDDGGYERPGDESARGVGAVQWFRTGRTTSVEQIVAVEEGRRLEYVLLRGIPVR